MLEIESSLKDNDSREGQVPALASEPSFADGVSQSTFRKMFAFAFMITLMACSPSSAQVSSTRSDALDAYLQKLDLRDLRITHLRRSLDQEFDDPKKAAIGQELADLYADKLMKLTDSSQDYQTTLANVRRLVSSVPSADTPSLQVMLLQAEYLRGYELVNQWLENRQDNAARDEALRILASVVPSLNSQTRRLKEEIEQLSRDIPGINNEGQQAAMETELRSNEVVHLRATFYAGWANYYAGVLLIDDTERAAKLNAAELAFREFVSLEPDDDLTKLDEGWVDLDSNLQVRGFAGLGMSLAAQGKREAAEHLFRLIQSSDATTAAVSEGPLWELQAWLNSNDVEAVDRIATNFIRSFTGKATRDQTRFCVALVRYAQRPPSGVSIPANLTALGLEGLVRLRQFRLIQELTTEYGLAIDSTNNFYLMWVQGNLAFAKGEETKDKKFYEQATRWFRSALELPEAHNDARSQGHCQYQLGWSLFLSGELALAADEFERASLLLKPFDEETAVNAAWKRYECFRQLSESDARFETSAIEALRGVKVGFPDSRLAQTASYHLARIERANSSVDQNIADLESVAPSDEQYVTSRYELCLLYHQQWSTDRGANQPTTESQAKLVQAVEKFLEVSDDGQSPQRLKSLLLLVDVGLRSNPRQLPLAKNYLTLARRESENVTATNTVSAEYHYQQFQLARLESRTSDAEREAEWLIDNAPGSDYVLSALVLIAQASDRDLAAADDDRKPALLDRAHSTYSRLVNLLGTDVATLQSNKNARVSLFRLGQIERQRGRPADAAQHFEKLLESNERSEVYLRAAGLAWFEAGREGLALPHWRVLSKGQSRGSEPWLEAKYYLIACLEQTDPEEARKVLKQFRLLYPTGKAENWEDRFQVLERRMGS